MSAQPAQRLEKILARVAREQGLDQERLRRWVSFLALCGVLEQAVERGVIDTYYLKGGVAMELRFARAARTTKDFDLGLVDNRTERIRKLEEILQLAFDAFTFRLKPEIHQMELADKARRGGGAIQDALLANGGSRSWSERSARGRSRRACHYRHRRDGTARDTAGALPQHSRTGAQKLHACTGPLREDRARDGLDILLLDMLAKLDDRRTRAATERIFAERATHAFPPNAALPADWWRELESLAQELGYRTTKAEEIEAEFVALVRRIAAAPVKRK